MYKDQSIQDQLMKELEAERTNDSSEEEEESEEEESD